MSENIVIQTGGEANTYSVEGLNTAVTGGNANNQTWDFVDPEAADFVKMTVGENGEYSAGDYEAKAITEVEVTEAITGVETEPDTDREIEARTPVITVGGKGRIMGGVKKLRVNQQGGDTVELTPAPVTGTLHATRKGIYRAADDGYEGYAAVIVNVQEGGGSGGGGWTDLPDEIRITTLPIKTVYANLEDIDLDGIVVKAYKNGVIWTDVNYPDGIIPIEELICDTKKADRYDSRLYVNLYKTRDLLYSLIYPSYPSRMPWNIEELDLELKNNTMRLQTEAVIEDVSIIHAQQMYYDGERWKTRQLTRRARISTDNEYAMALVKAKIGDRTRKTYYAEFSLARVAAFVPFGNIKVDVHEKYELWKEGGWSHGDKPYIKEVDEHRIYTPEDGEETYTWRGKTVKYIDFTNTQGYDNMPLSKYPADDYDTDKETSQINLNRLISSSYEDPHEEYIDDYWPYMFPVNMDGWGTLFTNSSRAFITTLMWTIAYGGRIMEIKWPRPRDHVVLSAWLDIDFEDETP